MSDVVPDSRAARESASYAEARSRRVELMLFLLAVGWCAFGMLFIGFGNPAGAAWRFVVGGVMFMLSMAARRDALIGFAVHVALGLSLTGLVAASLNPQFSPAPIAWYLVGLPVIAAALRGTGAAIAWGALGGLGILVVAWMQVHLGLVPRATDATKAITAAQLCLALFATLFSVISDSASRARESTVRTQAKRLGRQTRELEKARDVAVRADQAKSLFLANMSHELRTPLNAVIGMSSILRDSELRPDQREYVETIDESSQALLQVISDILDFSKIEAGKVEPESTPFDVLECVEGAVDMVAAEAQRRGIEIVLSVAPSVPDRLVSDGGRVRQILANLMANAVKFTDHGEIEVTVRADGTGSRRIVEFAVRDTGPGIQPEKLDALFQPFSQLDASTTREYGGTGLGLAISRALASLLGGRLWVESRWGEGATFTFSIEGEALPSARSSPDAPVSRLLRDRHVLVVDDNATALGVTARHLSRWGAIVETATSEADAVKKLAERPEGFSLAVLDDSVPTSGRSLVAALAEHLTPVLLLTPKGWAKETPDDGMTGRLGRVAAHVSKPVRRGRFANSIRACLDPRSSAPDRSAAAARVSRAEISSPVGSSVLLAEDNVINQRVAARMLTRLGYAVTVVDNGRLALDAIENTKFDVVLLDVQMPELDGIETAKRLVERYPHDQRPRIIGLTANALPGDRERCLAAGMDDYLAKPVQIGDLERVLTGQSKRQVRRASTLTDSFDLAVIEELRAADEGVLLNELFDIFLAEADEQLAELARHAESGALDPLGKAAHKLKSSVGSIGATEMYLTLHGIERASHRQDLDDARNGVARLPELKQRVDRAIERLR